MLLKKNRLTKKEFNVLYASGEKKYTENFFIFLKDSEFYKISVVAPANNFNQAVLRNSKRRDVYNILRENFINSEKQKEAIIFWKTNKDIDSEKIKNELKKIFI
jgi:ribonuclease P protein component